MVDILKQIIRNDQLHAKWLNTLSYMENAGAKKISACEDPVETSLMQLKHAAEEHRHAYYLKKQLKKLGEQNCNFYHKESLLGGSSTQHYLNQLDLSVCRYLKKQFNLDRIALKYAAYLLVTYAIEIRADLLYPIYQSCLDAYGSKVMVKSIILEEQGHLEEMTQQLKDFDADWEIHADHALQFENQLHEKWIISIKEEISRTIEPINAHA